MLKSTNIKVGIKYVQLFLKINAVDIWGDCMINSLLQIVPELVPSVLADFVLANPPELPQNTLAFFAVSKSRHMVPTAAPGITMQS